MKYTTEKDPDKSARAYGRELHCSPKHSENIARLLRGMKAKDAEQLLEDILAKKKAVPFTTHHGSYKHIPCSA